MPKPGRHWQSSGALAHAALTLALFFAHASVEAQDQRALFHTIAAEAIREPKGYEWLAWSTGHIGHRLTGSAQGQRAEETADSLFRVGGLDRTEYLPFSARAWQREAVDLQVACGDSTYRPACVALAHSPVQSAVRVPIVDLGNGLAADHDRLRGRLTGCFALVNIGLIGVPKEAGNLHRSEKTALALAAGVAGIIFVNNVEGHILLTGTASVNGSLIPVPAACISSEDGTLLRQWMAAGRAVEASLEMTNRSDLVTARNVIAEIKGSDLADEVVLVGGHLDSWDLATGATDNGLGSYSILDMARCLKASGVRPRRTIRFVLFMGEEQGLLGSRALVEQYRTTGELEKIRCMVNMDMTGHPQGFGVTGPDGWTGLIESINVDIRAQDTANFAGRTSTGAWLHSDHQPFMLAGVPVINPQSDLGGHVYGCYHSSCDDINLVDPTAMVDNVRFIGMLMVGLANAGELPMHFTDEQLRDRMIADGLEEKLRIGGDWRW